MFLRTVSIETRRAVDHLGAKCIPKRYYSAGVLKSPYEEAKVPEQTISKFIWSKSNQWDDLPAVTCGISGRSYTYGLAKLLTEQYAKALIAKVPLKYGDRMGLLMPNLPEYLMAIHGSIDAGFVPTFANPLYTVDEIARQFTNAEVRCIVTIPQLLDNALAVAALLKNYTYTINVGGKTEPDKKILGLQDLLADECDVELPKVDPSNVAILPYSSGTTGLPKAVALTHKNLTVNLAQCSDPKATKVPVVTGAHDQDVFLSVLPFFHIYGFNAILNFSIYNGAHMITIPRFTPSDYLMCLEKYKPIGLFAVPSLVLFLATHPDVKPKHLESVKRVLCAAAPITANIIKKLQERINCKDFTFFQGYGMTEMSPTALLTPELMPESKLGSVGRLLPSTEGKLVELTSNKSITSPNKPGELWIRGPQIMKKYLGNIEATNEILDADGWLHTGDVAYYDEDEYFYIIDRTKELIKVKGNQVSPTELESILMEIPGVSDCAVVGTPDDVAGELPRAFIVKSAGSQLTESEIKSHVDSKVAPFKKIEGGIKFIEAIPRNPSGKIMRHQLTSMKV